jgi:anti-sigma regulatory factor (Ser/Thr protein kinase)
VTIRLDSTPEAPREARLFVLATLLHWNHRDAAPLVSLVATELVTNAVVHTPRGPIDLSLLLEGESLHVGVTDTSPSSVPQMRATGTDAQNGYGLHIVDTLSTAWGYETTNGGKTVWADVDLDRSM